MAEHPPPRPEPSDTAGLQKNAGTTACREDRRRETRQTITTPIFIENLDPLPSGQATLRNYSRCGIYIEANQRHPVGTQLFVGIETSPYNPTHRRKYECHCVIVKWRRQLYSSEYLYGYGLEHRDPPGSCRRDFTVPIYEEDFTCELPQLPSEQRKHPRRQFRKAVFFNTGNGTLQGMVRDISRGGIFIETISSVGVGNPIKLAIPKTRLARQNALLGRIVRTDDLGLAVKFTGFLKKPKPGRP
ncbi:MAG TPA: PilZ domain-containing protein [Desulfobacterales bacterium]